MKPKLFDNRLTIFLLFACVLLAGILVFEQGQRPGNGTRSPPAQDTPSLSDTEVVQTRFVAPQMASFSEVLERPLFAPSRKPPPPPEPRKPVAQGRPDRFQLEGVAITPEAKVVVIRDLTRNELTRLSEGATHNGWLVESVHPAGVRLTRGKQSQELTLEPEDKSIRR